jgi:hypothetical protein
MKEQVITDLLIHVANAYRQFERQMMADVKRHYGRSSTELEELKVILDESAPFPSFFNSVRNMANHSGMPSVFLGHSDNNATKVKLDIQHLIESNSRHDKITTDLKLLEKEVEILGFVELWSTVLDDIFLRTTRLISREYLVAAKTIRDRLASYSKLPSDKFALVKHQIKKGEPQTKASTMKLVQIELTLIDEIVSLHRPRYQKN